MLPTTPSSTRRATCSTCLRLFAAACGSRLGQRVAATWSRCRRCPGARARSLIRVLALRSRQAPSSTGRPPALIRQPPKSSTRRAPPGESAPYTPLAPFLRAAPRPRRIVAAPCPAVNASGAGRRRGVDRCPYHRAQGREGGPCTGRREFQQTLLECLTEAALDGVIVIDAEGRIVALNQRFADLWGLSPQAVQARDRAAVTARIIEQLRDPQSFVSRSDYLHAHRHEVVTSVLSLRDGRTVEHYSTPIWGDGGQNGAFYGRLGWYRDVTDRTRAEATLRASRDELDAILRGVADGVTVQDETGRFVYANAAAADLAGFPSPETFLGTTADEVSARLAVLDAEGRPFPYSDLPGQRALGGEPAPEMLVQFRRLDSGEVRWALTRARAIRGADGEPLAISIFHDLTQRLLAERRLRFLAEAGAMLPASLDEAELLDGVTRLAVRTLAGGAAVYLRDEDGTVRAAASSHRDPQRAALMVETGATLSPPPGGPLPAVADPPGRDLPAPGRGHTRVRTGGRAGRRAPAPADRPGRGLGPLCPPRGAGARGGRPGPLRHRPRAPLRGRGPGPDRGGRAPRRPGPGQRPPLRPGPGRGAGPGGVPLHRRPRAAHPGHRRHRPGPAPPARSPPGPGGRGPPRPRPAADR